MSKVLISLSVPAVGENYELFIPDDLPLGELMPVVAKGVYELSGFRYQQSSEEVLCKESTGPLLELMRTVGDYGIKNGDHLIMV